MDATSSSVALQELLNNASTLNFNALLVADEQEAQRVIPQLQAFNKSVPEDIMVFSLGGSLHLPQMSGPGCSARDLIIPDVRKR